MLIDYLKIADPVMALAGLPPGVIFCLDTSVVMMQQYRTCDIKVDQLESHPIFEAVKAY